ncbi:hypothetical protein [Beggiatoa leptomitoformis]|uniref:Curli production assembly/transport component CsgF n=1 Tax=Beggiatoa leptomitoformis TaxID=288004 RepID=A0A2N9YCJ6_9GAMM|nr:hypothetical protein [Beggiatoa leptomitoformis]ALG66508.1 hypothetical protein AL038_00615 [Beggiatoa leptomitoformis]AUI68195.1 hypothetical protein BLE401_05430 [Beggiatoa leptomitoformis]
MQRKQFIILFLSIGFINNTTLAADRFKATDPNAAHREVQARFDDTSIPANAEYLMARTMNRVTNLVNQSLESALGNQDGNTVVNSVVVGAGSTVGDIVVINTGDTNVISR